MWNAGALVFCGAFFAGCRPLETHRSETVLSYQILGLPPDEDEQHSKDTVTEFLRHLDVTLELDQQCHEESGGVSLAGSDWEASSILADFITNPASGIYWNDRTLVELGSGLGKCAIAAGIMGSKVTATDASATSLKLIRQNIEKYEHLITEPIQTMPLLWGDEATLEAITSPDIVIASDVVYYRSHRESLRATIESLCSDETRVFIAHQWRVDPRSDEMFFQSFADRGFEVNVVATHLLPQSHQGRDSEGRTPITIFAIQRRIDTA